MVVAYDGTDFHGWQQQGHQPATISGKLERSFVSAFHHPVRIVGASRTDAGVHALGQVVVAISDLDMSPERMRHAWQRVLPVSILVRSLSIVPEFNPFNHVMDKTYFYHIFAQRPLPFVSRYGWFPGFSLDIERLKQGLAYFVGTHDFRAFCTLYQERDTVRTIYAIDVHYIARYKAWRIVVRGNAFLHFMIRRIVGACVTVARNEQLPLSFLSDTLLAKNPCSAFLKAPAHGLLLYKIRYNQ